MRHKFLVISRQYTPESNIEEREYYYDYSDKMIVEVKTFYDAVTGRPLDFIPAKEKKSKFNSFIINLETMLDHPGKTFEDSEFIQEYAKAVIDGVTL
jgi:hypothetical protein